MAPQLDMPMMACGHRANSMGTPAGETESRPACVICSCFIIASSPPDLTGRRARCHHYGQPTHRSECHWRGDRDGVCYCEQPSDAPLPFFEYLGPSSFTAAAKCVCGLYERPHWPPWELVVLVDRNWFKCGRIDFKRTATLYARTQEEANDAAEAKRVEFLNWNGLDGGTEDTKIFGARIRLLRRIRRTVKCPEFQPLGAAEFDSFYCGCHSWD